LILLIYIYLKNKKLIFILLIIYLLFIILKYKLIIFYYYNYFLKNEIKNINNFTKYKNLELKTGDIIQCGIKWNNTSMIEKIKNILLEEVFMETFIVIKYKNKDYGLFFTSKYLKFIKNRELLELNDNIKIILLNDIFIEYNFININYFRLIQVKKEIPLDNIIQYIEYLDKLNFKYNYNTITFIYNKNKIKKELNSTGFILYFLYFLKIIKFINFNNIEADDLTFLPNISNNYYNEIIYFNYK
jgi:hypothetical protein